MITIRQAVGTEDLETARGLLREYAGYLNEAVGAEHINLKNFEDELGTLPAPYDALLVAYAEDDAAGTVAIKPLLPIRSEAMQQAFPEERAAEMKRLWVGPQFRGLAIGRKLAMAAMDAARERGYTAIYLDTMPTVMTEATALYESLGFVPVEQYLKRNNVLNFVPNRIPGCEDNHAPGVAFFRLGL